MEKARRQGSKESPVVGLKFCFKLFPTYLSSTPVGFGMHLGKWGLAPTLHIGFFSHPRLRYDRAASYGSFIILSEGMIFSFQGTLYSFGLLPVWGVALAVTIVYRRNTVFLRNW